MEMRASIVVADDDREITEMLALFLRRQGHDVTKCFDGDEAWEAIQQVRPDLAILDILMPKTSGLEICHRIQAVPQLNSTAVLLISARSTGSEIVEGLKAGAADYITKPFVNAEILARVRSVLRRRKLLDEKMRHAKLRHLNEQLNQVLHELGHPTRELLQKLKEIKEISMPHSEASRSGEMLYTLGMKTFLTLRNLQEKRNSVLDKVQKDQ